MILVEVTGSQVGGLQLHGQGHNNLHVSTKACTQNPFFRCTIALFAIWSTLSVRDKLLKVGVCPIGPLPVLVASVQMLGSVAAWLLA